MTTAPRGMTEETDRGSDTERRAGFREAMGTDNNTQQSDCGKCQSLCYREDSRVYSESRKQQLNSHIPKTVVWQLQGEM